MAKIDDVVQGVHQPQAGGSRTRGRGEEGHGRPRRPKQIDCFVSGVDITAGSDWRREIRSRLAKSHLLLLLFTAPTKNWDWCLYETGLYTRFDLTEPRSVVCLFDPGQASPSPLADLQGVPVDVDKAPRLPGFVVPPGHGRFPTTGAAGRWRPRSRPIRWRRRLVPSSRAFRRSGSASTHYPCHRLVLSFSESDDMAKGIPESARVVVGPNDTTEYTMSLFDLGGGERHAELGRSVGGRGRDKSGMAKELDTHFLLALKEELFRPSRPHALRRQEPGSGAALPSDPLQHLARAPGRAACRTAPPGPTSGPAP